MRIAISSNGKDLESEVAEVFARCPYFIIAEIEDREVKNWKAIENKIQNTMSGAGITVAQFLAENKVDAIITKNIGPRAFDVLRQFNINVYYGSGTIKEVLQKFINENLKRIER